MNCGIVGLPNVVNQAFIQDVEHNVLGGIVMGCDKQKENMKNCNCTYEPCSRKGICCECIAYHRAADELPACYFPDNIERSFDRSIKNFIRINSN